MAKLDLTKVFTYSTPEECMKSLGFAIAFVELLQDAPETIDTATLKADLARGCEECEKWLESH